MGSVVEFAPPLQRASLAPSYRDVRAASRWLEGLFTLLTGALLALAVFSLWVLLFYQGNMIAVGPRGGLLTTEPLPPDFIPFSAWRLDQKLAYVPVIVGRSAPAIGLSWCLRSLFRLYRRGEVFGRNNAALIRAMGLWLLADAAAPFLCHLVLSATGYEIDKVWAHLQSLQELVLGAVVTVIAMVMRAGHEIEQDREGFV